jgi:hypothetical protein
MHEVMGSIPSTANKQKVNYKSPYAHIGHIFFFFFERGSYKLFAQGGFESQSSWTSKHRHTGPVPWLGSRRVWTLEPDCLGSNPLSACSVFSSINWDGDNSEMK